MTTASPRYGLEEEDEALAYSESKVMNITDDVVQFKIATTPGTKPRRYTLAPYGQPGSSVDLQTGYTKPYKGAGRQMCPPIIEGLTMRHVHDADLVRQHDGSMARIESPRLPQVVHADEAKRARQAWLNVLARRAAQPKTQTLVVEVNQSSEPVRANVKPAAPEPDDLIGEEVGQDDIEPPHPDDVEAMADGPPPDDAPEEVPMRKPRGAKS